MSTTKRILVLRHGKSDWEADYGADHDRPLARRGKRGADAVGRFLAAIGEVPDLVISSSARRALDTAERAMKAGDWGSDLEVAEALYGASAADVLAMARTVDEAYRSVLFAGHEPTCSTLVGRLIGEGHVRMVTAALARVDFDIDDWSALGSGAGTLRWLVTPRVLHAFTKPR